MLIWAGKKGQEILVRETPRAKAQKQEGRRYMEQRVPVMGKKNERNGWADNMAPNLRRP